MSNVTERLADIDRRVESARTRATRAALAREQAEERIAKTKAALKDEFGVSTGAEIRAKREELESNLESSLASIEADLEAAGA